MNIKIYPMIKKLFTFVALVMTCHMSYAQPIIYPYSPTNCSGTGYPTPGAACGSYYINKVTTTGGTLNINNSTSCSSPNNYTLYTGTNKTWDINAGATATLNVAYTTTSGVVIRWAFWIDWNQDGQFNNTFYTASNPDGELIQTYVASSPTVTPFIINPKAKNGLTRLRVRAFAGATSAATDIPFGYETHLGGSLNPCETGPRVVTMETEDYDMFINNPCVKVPAVTFSNTNSKGTDVSIVVKGNEKVLEYVVDQTLADPGTGNHLINSTTTAIHIPDTFMKTINCNQKYYFHIRGICDTDSHNQSTYYYGPWRTDSFTTDPCCDVPDVNVGNITSYTALATWGPVTSVQNYEYMIRIDTVVPTKGTITNGNSVFLPGLACSKEYYFFLRALCSPTPLSDWSVDSFLTQPCLSIDNTPVLPPFRLNAYPNPVRDVVTLSVMHGMKLSKGNITVVDMTGKAVMNAEMYDDKLELDVHTLPSGLYMIKYNDGERSEMVKINKQ